MMRRFFLYVGVCLTLLALSACGGGGGSSQDKPVIMFVSSSADAGGLDFKMNDDISASNLAYLGTTPNFAEFDFRGADVDGWDVSLHLTGGGTEIDRQAIVFGIGTDSLVIAHGIKNYSVGEEVKRLRFTPISANRLQPIGNKARLIIFHGFERSAGKSTPAVEFRNPSETPLYNTGSINPGASATLLVDSGSQDWEIRRAGASGVFASKTQNLQPGKVYLVLLSGIEDDPTPANQVTINFIEIPSTL
ncbi:MAG: DUF4397 domain-containing protein [Fimbriimonadaceae bacterium]|nr:MAG: DUF4397 domain-containing protein [Fimbriimonadaceae bacterium]